MAGQQISRAQKKDAEQTLIEATARQLPLLKAMRIREEAFSRVLVNALMRQPQLALCTKDSLFLAVFAACDMGLLPDGKHGAIVPIRKGNVLTADFWPMVGGLLTAVRAELKNVAIQAHNVFAGDQWEDIRGTSPQLVHVVNGGVDRLSEDSLVCSYSTVHFAGNDTPEFEVMYLPELHKFKKNNRGPWSTHPLEMYRVRPLKRVLKRLPVSGGLMAKLNRGDEDDFEQPAGYTFEGEAEVVDEKVNPAPPPRQRAAPPPADPAQVDDDDLTIDPNQGQDEDPGAGAGDMF